MEWRSSDEPAEYETRLRPLAALAKLLPCIRGCKPPNRCTVYRWARYGLKTRSGHHTRLQARFVGGTLCASLADAQRFFDSIDDVEWVPPKTPLSRREERAIWAQASDAYESLRRTPGGRIRPLEKHQLIIIEGLKTGLSIQEIASRLDPFWQQFIKDEPNWLRYEIFHLRRQGHAPGKP